MARSQSSYVTVDEDLFPGEDTPLHLNDVRRWIGQAKLQGAAEERARVRERVEAVRTGWGARLARLDRLEAGLVEELFDDLLALLEDNS